MANYVTNTVIFRTKDFSAAKNKITSDQSQFDLNLIAKPPKSLPESISNIHLQSLSHVLFKLEMDIDKIEELLEPTNVEVRVLFDYHDDYKSAVKTFYSSEGKLIHKKLSADYPNTLDQFNLLGQQCFDNLVQYKAIDCIQWKKDNWGIGDLPEGVEWANKKVTFHTRWMSASNGVSLWMKQHKLTGTYYVLETGCHWWRVVEFQRGNIIEVRESNKSDLRTVLKKGCGYRSSYINRNYNLD